MTLLLPGTPEYERILNKSVALAADRQRGILLPNFRQVYVSAVSTSDASCTIQVGGDPTVEISGVKFIRGSYRPQLGDYVWAIQNGTSYIILGMIGELQTPAPTAWEDEIVTAQGTTATTYGNLATVGPTVSNKLLYKGETVLINVSAGMDISSGPGHAACMAPQVSGAGSLSPIDDNAAITQDSVHITISQQAFFVVSTTGQYTVQAKYKAITSGTATFDYRKLSVVILRSG